MLSDNMRNALNKQVNEELASAYIYMGMAAYFDALNLHGFAYWMQQQAAEERGHATRIYDYLYDRGARVELLPLSAPPALWENPLDAFQDALAHERKISGLINDLMDMAVAEKDHATQAFLHWFVNEQVEEEAAVDDIIQRLKLVGEAETGLYMLDRELGARSNQGGAVPGEE